MAERVLVALGGNALVKAGQEGTLEEQATNLVGSLTGVVDLVRRGHRLVITHGNGPQVGHILIRSEAGRGKAYELPLDVCVAQSQGEIGYLIQQTLQNLFHRHGVDRRVAVVLSRTVVDREDPRMKNPTKPVGPFYTSQEASELRERGYRVMEDARRGYRRVVPSPLPARIMEEDVIHQLFDDGIITVAVGGGGIPVCVEPEGTMEGVEAVVDKDYASTVLASALGVDRVLDLTGVEYAKLNFGLPEEQNLEALTVMEARKYLDDGHFAPGSMGPKIEAAIQFLENGGREVIITLPEKALEAFDGRTGTHVYPARGGPPCPDS